MTMTRRSVFAFLGGAAVAFAPFAVSAAVTVSGPTLDDAVRTIGPEGMAKLASRYADFDEGQMWRSRIGRHAEAAARLASERGELSCETFLHHAGFDAMRSGISNPSLSTRTRLLTERYVTTLPGYEPELRRQRQTTLDQHGYAHLVLLGMIRALRDAGDSVVPQVIAGTVDWKALDRTRRTGLA